MKKLGISIDGVIRDLFNQFDKHYKKVFIHNQNLVGMTDDFQVDELSDEQAAELTKKIEEATKERITYPLDTFDLLNHYKFEDMKLFENKNSFKTSKDSEFVGFLNENEFNLDTIKLEDDNTEFTPKEALDNFMFDKYPFQIFGDAEPFPRAGEKFNQIQAFGAENEMFETVLITDLKGQAITATLYFLHKAGCRPRNFKVVPTNMDKWKECDVLIDVDPEVLQNKPDGKTAIKIDRDFNKWDTVDYSFEGLADIAGNRALLEKLFKK